MTLELCACLSLHMASGTRLYELCSWTCATSKAIRHVSVGDALQENVVYA